MEFTLSNLQRNQPLAAVAAREAAGMCYLGNSKKPDLNAHPLLDLLLLDLLLLNSAAEFRRQKSSTANQTQKIKQQ